MKNCHQRNQELTIQRITKQMTQHCVGSFTAEQAIDTEELLETSFPASLGAHIVSDGPSSSSDDDDDYSLTTEDVEGVWNDWLKQQPKESIKLCPLCFVIILLIILG